jgi:hypothetical protein
VIRESEYGINALLSVVVIQKLTTSFPVQGFLIVRYLRVESLMPSSFILFKKELNSEEFHVST